MYARASVVVIIVMETTGSTKRGGAIPIRGHDLGTKAHYALMMENAATARKNAVTARKHAAAARTAAKDAIHPNVIWIHPYVNWIK